MTEVIHDLTMCIKEGMQTFSAPWHPVVEITQLGRHGIENRETRKILIGTHTGTHVDAPRHFIPNGATLDQVPLDTLCGKAKIINFSALPECYEICAQDLENAFESTFSERVIFRFDWDKKALMTNRYYTHHPFLSLEAAEWLVKKKVKLVGMDTPQPDNPLHSRTSEKDAQIHKYLLGNGVILVEYLVGLDAVRSTCVDFFAAPLKIENSDGSPARCFALERF